jgi:hypothetical protein
MKLLLCAWLLAAGCVDQRGLHSEASLACEDVERELLARVRRAIRAEQLTDIPVEQLSLRVLDDADARYLRVEVRAPSGRLPFSYRVERATGALSAAALTFPE